MKAPIAGGPAVTVITVQGNLGSIAVDASAYDWTTDASGGPVVKLARYLRSGAAAARRGRQR